MAENGTKWEREVVGLNAVFHTKNKMPPPHVLRVVRHECRNPATRVACDKCRNLMMNEKAACLVDMIRIRLSHKTNKKKVTVS